MTTATKTKKKTVSKQRKKRPDNEKLAVHCSHDEMWPLDRFQEHPQNPNEHSKAQIQLLAHIIKTQGWRKPITVSKRSGFITAGHGRLYAARLLNLPDAPVDLQEYASEELEIADVLADNRLAELSDINTIKVTDVLETLISNTSFDPLLTGYTTDQIDALLHPDRDETEPVDSSPEIFGVIIECDDEEQQRKLLEEMLERDLRCRALM